jgi:perosamine synthetase
MDIPVFKPVMGTKEVENVVEAVSSGDISGTFGRFIGEFEAGFAAYCHAEHGVATSSGTTALQLALRAYGVGRGDQVILPTFTNIATCLAVVYEGATPIVVDSERRTWNMDVEQVERVITPQTKAIMPVHIYGHPVDMDPLMALADQHEFFVIEDAAEAHGAEYKGKRVGALKDGGCFSFYANKVITTGEGGMFLTNDSGIAERARTLRDLGFLKEQRFLHRDLGFNFRMSNVAAAIGVGQLSQIDTILESKIKVAARYSALLGEVEGITLPVEEPWAKNVYWMYSILVEDSFGVDRNELMSQLQAAGIQTRTFFIGMHAQPAFHDIGLFIGQECPVADEIASKGLYLPSAMDLTEEEIEYVCDSIKLIQARGRKDR